MMADVLGADGERVSLCVLDVLPARSSLSTAFDPAGRRVRFRAIDSAGRESEWSGWFPLGDCPVYLTWAAFTWPGDEP